MKHHNEKLSADAVNGYSGTRLGPEASRELFWTAPELVAAVDAKGRLLMVNHAVTESTGYREEELLGACVFDYMLPGQRERVCDDLGWTKSARRPVISTKVSIRRKDGSELLLEVRASVIEGACNDETVLAIGHDITSQRRLESELEEFDERVRFFFEESHIGMTYVNRKYRYLAVNRALSEMTGFPMEAFIGKTVMEMYGSDSEISKYYRHVFDIGKSVRRSRIPFNVPNRQDRQPGYADAVLLPVKDSAGNVIAASAFVVDVTEHVLAEKTARESQQLYRATVESASDIICTIDREHRFVSVNQKALAQLRVKPEQIIGKKVSDVTQPKLADFLEEKYEEVFETGEGLQFEKVIEVRGQEQRWSYSLNPVFDEDDNTTRLVLIARDMTDARRDQQEMARLFEAICCCDDGIALADDGGNILFVNPVMEQMTGYRSGELLAKPISAFGVPNSGDFTRIIRSLEERGKFRGEVLTRRKDGSSFPAELSVSIVTDVEGKSIGFVSSVRDITERRRAEEALRRERDNLINILETMEDGVYIADEHYELQYVNPALSNDFGPWEGLKCYEYFDDQNDVCPWCKNREFFAGKTDHREWHCSKNGKTYDLIDTPLRNPNGSVSRLEIFRDITQRKKAEEALRSSEEVYRLHFENIRDVVYATDRDFRVTSISPSVEAAIGYRPEEIVGRKFDELNLLSPEYLEQAFANSARVLAGERIPPSEYEFIRKDGTKRVAEVSGAPLWKDGQIVAIINVARDITDRKRAEEELVETKDYLQSLLDNANDIIFTQDLDWKLTFVNRRGLEILGYTPEEWRDLDPINLLIGEDAEEGLKRREKMIKGIPTTHESRVRRKNGEIATLSISTVPIVKAGKVTGMFSIARDFTRKKKLESELEESKTEARLLSKKLMEAQEEERRRISRDLHDELGQFVTSAKMHVDNLAAFMDRGRPEAQDVANGLHKRLDATLAAIRRISFSLRPSILDDLGLIPAIESYLEQFEQMTRIQCDWDCRAEDEDYPPEVKTALYRILQEALTNVARHAKANRVRVGLFQKDGKLVMTIEDAGCGFERSKIDAGQSLGLIGMRERANLVGGSLTVSSNIGLGTKIEAEVPTVQPH